MSVICRVAVVPTPPLLVPELAAGAAEETAPVRDACLAAVRAVASECGKWIAVGAGRTPTEIGAGARGSFRGYGVDVPVTLSGDDVRDPREKSVALPLPALVAGWLRERADAASVRVRVLDQALPRAACVGLGHRLGEDEDGVGLLILGDGYTVAEMEKWHRDAKRISHGWNTDKTRISRKKALFIAIRV